MHVGLVDVDKSGFPNLCLMKISSYHKSRGDTTELLRPLDILGGYSLFTSYDKLYAASVFSGNDNIVRHLREAGVVVGGTGSGDPMVLPAEMEHAFPDYGLYGVKDIAYGFLIRGCPRHCPFCVVGEKEGIVSRKVADLSEFWNGQKRVVLLDPNLLACKDYKNLLMQLVDSRAWVDFTQGLDIRFMTDEIIDILNSMNVRRIHFAWDDPRDEETPVFLEYFRKRTKIKEAKFLSVYVLTNYWSNFREDLQRVYWLRSHGYDPFIMIYDKEHAPRNVRLLQRYVNNKRVFRIVERFEDFDPKRA